MNPEFHQTPCEVPRDIADLAKLFIEDLPPEFGNKCQKAILNWYNSARDPRLLSRFLHDTVCVSVPIPAGYFSSSLVDQAGSIEVRHRYFQSGKNGMIHEYWITVGIDGKTISKASYDLGQELFKTLNETKEFRRLCGS